MIHGSASCSPPPLHPRWSHPQGPYQWVPGPSLSKTLTWQHTNFYFLGAGLNGYVKQLMPLSPYGPQGKYLWKWFSQRMGEEFNSHLTIPFTPDPEPIQPYAMPATDYEPEPNTDPDIPPPLILSPSTYRKQYLSWNLSQPLSLTRCENRHQRPPLGIRWLGLEPRSYTHLWGEVAGSSSYGNIWWHWICQFTMPPVSDGSA